MRELKKLLKLPLYIMTHPADGMYAMKYEKQGRLWIAFLNMGLMWLSYSVQKRYTGFAFNELSPSYMNSLLDLAVIALLLLLFCVANWSVTTLTDGEGSLKDIAMAVGYAMTPIVLIFIPATILSRGMVENEKEFFYLLNGAAVFWSAVLLFMGIYTVHNYTVVKTAATFVLTFIAMLVIGFLIGLVFSLLGQTFIFVQSVYRELLFRQ